MEALIDKHKAEPSHWTRDDLWHSCVESCYGTLCAICGLHIGGKPHDEDWRNDAFVVQDPTREYECVQTNRSYTSIDQDPAVYSAKRLWEYLSHCAYSKGCCFELQGTVEAYVYASEISSNNGGPEGRNNLYLPMHQACLSIALKAPVWDQMASTALRALFRVLRHRYQVIWEQMLRVFPVREMEYLIQKELPMAINFGGFQNTEDIDRGYCSKLCFRLDHIDDVEHYLAADPLHIPALTETLLENLEPSTLSNPTKKTVLFRKKLASLPFELQAIVFRHVTSAQDWPLQCTRMLGPRFWKALFNKNHPCMMWLWDLDYAMIRQTDPSLEMDWELLFRKLTLNARIADCRSGSAEPEYQIFRGVLDNVPPGLEGRRRIWKLIDEMYIVDKKTLGARAPYGYTHTNFLAEIKPPMVEIPVYWGRYGEPFNDEELQML